MLGRLIDGQPQYVPPNEQQPIDIDVNSPVNELDQISCPEFVEVQCPQPSETAKTTAILKREVLCFKSTMPDGLSLETSYILFE